MTPYEMIASMIRVRSGIVLGPDKLYLVETRLAPILRREGLRDLGSLAERLRDTVRDQRGTELAREVVEAMTTNETLFFRDSKPFVHLKQQALMRLHQVLPAGQPMRIWSAAASTGQEAYSLAMVVAEVRAAMPGRRVEIVGTDLARDPIRRAQEGVYTQFEVQRGLPVHMLVKYFDKVDQGWRVKDSLRSLVEFREWNLLSNLGQLGIFDIVFCRNVLIYFDPPTKGRVLEAISRQISQDGLLYLGGSETTFGLTDSFLALATERAVYTPAYGPRERAA